MVEKQESNPPKTRERGDTSEESPTYRVALRVMGPALLLRQAVNPALWRLW